MPKTSRRALDVTVKDVNDEIPGVAVRLSHTGRYGARPGYRLVSLPLGRELFVGYTAREAQAWLFGMLECKRSIEEAYDGLQEG